MNLNNNKYWKMGNKFKCFQMYSYKKSKSKLQIWGIKLPKLLKWLTKSLNQIKYKEKLSRQSQDNTYVS